MPLAESTLQTVEATAGLVAAQGPEFTRAFYQRMLGSNEPLKDIFNLAHQDNLRQPQALFDSVVAYALNIRKINEFYAKKEEDKPIAPAELAQLQGFFSVAERIAQKHTSFGIKPPQYQIVGANLLATIEDRVTKDQAILGEWGKAYEFLANMLIKREEEIYVEVEGRKNGWRPTRTFRVAEKTKVNEIVTQFKLVPTNKEGVTLHKPGQYLAIFARNPTYFKYQEIRQYSIISAPNEKFYEIAVRKDDKGIVSQYLHDHVKVDDLLELAPPYGDFYMEYLKPEEKAAEDKLTSLEFRTLNHSAVNFAEHKDTPIVFISGGVGQNPLFSMLKLLAREEGKNSTRPLFWVHAAHSSAMRAFKKEVKEIKEKDLPKLELLTFLTEVNKATDRQGDDFDVEGHFNLDAVRDVLALEEAKKAPHYFFVGPEGFMKVVEKQLKDKNIPDERIHFEMFGPFKSLA